MASLYPGALDSFSTIKADATVSAGDHKNHHNDLADAVNKIEAELGIDPAGTAATVVARLDAIFTLAEAVNLVLGTATGTKIGTSASQKLGFFNATPIVQPSGSTDLRQALINLGLYATGGASPLNLNGGTLTAASVTGLGAPVNASDAATKAYADAIATGLDVKQSVRAATTANITLSGTQTIDTVAVVAGERVLVKNQTAGAENGIYVCSAGAWSRSTDADISAEVNAGMFVFVEAGGQGDSGWVLSTNNPITLGTTALVFTQFSGTANSLSLGGGTMNDGANIAVGSTTGTKLATAITQKLGFWNKTPVVQPAAYTLTGASADRAYTKQVYAPTNVTTDLVFDANSTSLDELADVVGSLCTKFNELQDLVMTLAADIQSVGLVG